MREGSLSKHINFTEVTSYKIHILVRLITNGQIVKNLYLKFNKNLVTITLSAHGQSTKESLKKVLKFLFIFLVNWQEIMSLLVRKCMR